MYQITFPFRLSPLLLRAVTIHGDGSYNKINNQIEYYQHYKNIHYFESLLRTIFSNIAAKRKDDVISYVSIPSILFKLVCKSLNLKIEDFHSEKFFYQVAKLPLGYRFQVFLQFFIDEGYLKETTMAVSQKKQNMRTGFFRLLESLNFDHLKPKNSMDDITIYAYNFLIILDHLNRATEKYGYVAGLWFKEEKFRKICKHVNIKLSRSMTESRVINKDIFNRLSATRKIISYQDIRNFDRTYPQAQKAIRCWKKNGLINRVGFNQYEIL